MVILKTESEFGHAPPPQTPYSIISNLPGWEMLERFREGDMSPMAKVVHIYPRFAPTHAARELGGALAQKLGMEGNACLFYLNPIMWPYTTGHVQNPQRKEHAISPDNLTFKVVDIAGHRLYAVLYSPQYTMALIGSWGTPGLCISIRGAERLLKGIDTAVEVPYTKGDAAVPTPTWTPEGPDHELLRQRIVDIFRHGAIDPAKVQCETKDVFLYPSGMGAVFHSKNLIQEYLPGGHNVELGVVFHNTHELMHEESAGMFKHLGKVDKAALDEMEAWLAGGGKITYTIVEFPGNPTLESVDLLRLKKLSETYNFVLIVDDTIGSAANIDVLAASDMVLTSLTKSFNGRSDALGGCIVLNPLSPHYGELSRRFASTHVNELFAEDAAVLLANAHDYYERTRVLNANAQGMAEFLHRSIAEVPGSPVVQVRYPSLLASKPHYDAFKRKGTPELPEPGYGCLLNVDFESRETAMAFYDNCGFYPSPHLGGHVTIMLAYNMLMFGKDPKEAAEVRDYGAKGESIRFSAGLEKLEDLVDTLKFALDKAIEAKKAAAADKKE